MSGSTKPQPGVTHNEFATARYDAALLPDPEFNVDGTSRVDFGDSAVAQDVAIDSHLRIVQVGFSTTAGDDQDFALTRFRPTDGFYDNGFSSDGKLITTRSGIQQGKAVAIQPDDKIVVAGQTDVGFAIARYNPNGTLDTSFSGDGKQTADLGGNDIAEGLALQSDGKIVLAGYQGAPYGLDNTFAIARFEGGGAPPPDPDPDPVPPTPLPPIPNPVPLPPAAAQNDVFTGLAGQRNLFRAGPGRATTA